MCNRLTAASEIKDDWFRQNILDIVCQTELIQATDFEFISICTLLFHLDSNGIL